MGTLLTVLRTLPGGVLRAAAAAAACAHHHCLCGAHVLCLLRSWPLQLCSSAALQGGVARRHPAAAACADSPDFALPAHETLEDEEADTEAFLKTLREVKAAGAALAGQRARMAG